MADALRASCAAPVFKRPRLEYSSCDNDTLISYESVSSEERFSVDSGLQEDAYDMTSSNEGPIESVQENNSINGIPEPSTSSMQDPSLEHGIITDHANGFSADVFNDIAILSDPPTELEEPNFEEHDSTISELSGLSDLSNYSEDIEPNSASASWVQRQRNCGIDPRMILGEILPKGTMIPLNVNDGLLWRYIINMLNEPRRSKLNDINTLDDVVRLLKTCKNIIVLTGAGVSVSCGIPDFRSRNGIYARLSNDYPDLPDPQAMFDISYFRRDPRPFFKFAKEIYPGQFQPTPSHRFIKLLERQGKLLRNYTQNIDTLEHTAGIKNVITCHGSFATATCTICRYKVDSSVIKEDIFNQTIPYCPICPSDIGDRGIMKPDIVFFGEGLSDEFHDNLACDKEICDLLIVIGSSLKVRPVAMIPCSIPMNVPQILINREPLKHLTFDIELLGDCDGIIGELCKRLQPDWSIEDIPSAALSEITFPPPVINPAPLDFSEINNNSATRTDAPTSSLSQGEESNSCDYRGMSAIKLDDSEDGSSDQDKPTEDAPETKEDEVFSAGTSREDCLKKLPDSSYMFIPPNRYIFQGAEINKEDEDDDSRSSCTDYSSDSEDPHDNPAAESTDNSTSPPRFLPQAPSPSTSPQLTKEDANT